MAEETQPAATPAAEEVVAAPPPETKEPPPPLEEEVLKSAAESPSETTKPAEESIAQSVSFKEESNRVSDLPDPEKKALEELKTLIEEALKKHEFTVKEEEKPAPAPEPAPESAAAPPPPEKTEEEPPKEETTVEKAEETTPPPQAPAPESDPPAAVEEKTAAVAEVIETTEVVTTVEDDGAKTVEAIEETVVAVSTPPESAPPAEEPPAPAVEPATEPELPPEEVFIWGIPLLGDEKSDVLLLKFLRARDFKVKEAFAMIKNTVKWRKSFEIEKLLEEDLGSDLENVVFMYGFDKESHPVCYNVYGEFQNKELYQKTFSDEEKRLKFLRWRIQFLEKGIRQLDFSPTGICTLVQVTDLKNSPGPAKRDLRQATNQALSLLQDNYPEFVAKQIFINVPWWYLTFNRMISPFLTQRTKSKFVFAGPSKSTETLFKYIAPEQVPVQYGGLSKENDPDFSTADAVTELTIKPASKQTVEIPVTEICTLVWELRVVGWDVIYSAEFVPTAEEAYTVIVQKSTKISVTDEAVIKNTFKVGEPGKVVLTLDNTTSKKKKLLYRSKPKSSD